MKKNIIALAIAAAVAAPVANAAPTVYGQINLAVQSNAKVGKPDHFKADQGVTIGSIASRLGFKGTADLGHGLKAIYKLEYGITPDEKTQNIAARNSYVGLSGGFGTALVGRHDSPVKMVEPSDLFNDGMLDNGRMSNTGLLNKSGGEDRFSNVLAYVSPTFSGVKLIGAVVGNENAGTKNGLTNAYSVAALYGSKKKGLFLSAVYEAANETFYNAVGTKSNFGRLSAQYRVAGLVANAFYQASTNDTGAVAARAAVAAVPGNAGTAAVAAKAATTTNGNSIVVSVGYKVGNFLPKIKYSQDGGDLKGTALGLGVDYKLGKKTKLYVEAGSFDRDMVVTAGAGNKSVSTLSLGMLHKF